VVEEGDEGARLETSGGFETLASSLLNHRGRSLLNRWFRRATKEPVSKPPTTSH
jgi:hypothetical protein